MKKNIKLFLFLLISFLILFESNDVYADNCDKYACAKCVYTYGKFQFNYDVKSNGDGTLSVDYSANLPTGVSNISITNNVSEYVFKNTTTNKIECNPIYLFKTATGGETQWRLYDKNADDNRQKLEASSDSTNNNKNIVDDTSKIKSCSFTDNVTKITCNVQISNNKIVSTDCGTFKLSGKSDISSTDFSKPCSDIKLNLLCDTTYGYCTLSKTGNPGNNTTGSDTKTGDDVSKANYTCNYVGKKTGKTLKIEKYDSYWNITHPNGSTQKVDVSKTGSNVYPTDSCDDIFYLYNVASPVRTVISSDKYAEAYITQYCSTYKDVEQFCSGTTCKIDNPSCGNSSDSDTSGCPKKLRPIFGFIKIIVLNVLKIIVPIALIVMGSVDMLRAVAASDEKAIKESASRFIRRCIAAIAIFFVVTIVTVLMDIFAKTDIGAQNEWKSCWTDLDS